jgi:hypothetical protein
MAAATVLVMNTRLFVLAFGRTPGNVIFVSMVIDLGFGKVEQLTGAKSCHTLKPLMLKAFIALSIWKAFKKGK